METPKAPDVKEYFHGEHPRLDVYPTQLGPRRQLVMDLSSEPRQSRWFCRLFLSPWTAPHPQFYYWSPAPACTSWNADWQLGLGWGLGKLL